MADANIECAGGRLYPAKALKVFTSSAYMEVDLGFGTIYRGDIRLGCTKEYSTVPAVRKALSAKIEGQQITLCVHSQNRDVAWFFVNGENVNLWMVKNGYLDFTPVIGCCKGCTAF